MLNTTTQVASLGVVALVLSFTVTSVAFAAETTTDSQLQIGVAKECVKGFVGVREDAVQTAYGTYASTLDAALDARKSAVLSAIESKYGTKELTTSIRTAWKTYKEVFVAASKKLKVDRKAAWTKYMTGVKAECRVKGLSGEVSNQ